MELEENWRTYGLVPPEERAPRLRTGPEFGELVVAGWLRRSRREAMTVVDERMDGRCNWQVAVDGQKRKRPNSRAHVKFPCGCTTMFDSDSAQFLFDSCTRAYIIASTAN